MEEHRSLWTTIELKGKRIEISSLFYSERNFIGFSVSQQIL
jgi:hypothetical protein